MAHMSFLLGSASLGVPRVTALPSCWTQGTSGEFSAKNYY